MTSTLRKLALGTFLSVSALTAVTLTSCNKEDETCTVGLTGKDCKTEIRASYYNSYKGNGTDNEGGTYTGFTVKFSSLGTDPTKMNLQLLDDKLSSVNALTVTLTTNTAFNIDQKVSGDYTYTGTGTINESSCSVTITEKKAGITTTTTTYTFNNMVKQ
ncbi:MAG TPA: hypothetical protein VL092_07015 [Chitinophagaceae bacterium]|nr:hypothetical protein [Chitinophagaceae bacterium]